MTQGSQYWLREAVNSKVDIIDTAIKKEIPMDPKGAIPKRCKTRIERIEI